MREMCPSKENIWINYARLHQKHPSSDSEPKVNFYRDNSEFIRRNSTDHNPEMAVIIPAFNESACIPRTLASINSSLEGQRSVTVIVVDNASTDETSEIAAAFGSHVVRETKKGIGHARQAGLESVPSSVKYVLTTDADTVVIGNWFELHRQTLANPDTVACYGLIRFISDTQLGPIDKLMLSGYTLAASLVHSINNHHKSFVCGGANMGYKKEAADICGGYNRNLSRGEDTDILSQMSSLGKISQNSSAVITSARRIIGEGILKHSLDRLKDNFSRYSGKNPVSTNDTYKDYR